MDSSVRHPPPRCHPGTRVRINGRFKDWLDDQKREHKMTWISGLAGTGKSATAQIFAKICAERRRLGAAVCLFRRSGPTDPNTVIPSIAYQLASTVPEYRSLLTQYTANDLRVLEKTAQLENVVVEPLSLCEIVEIIGEIVR